MPVTSTTAFDVLTDSTCWDASALSPIWLGSVAPKLKPVPYEYPLTVNPIVVVAPVLSLKLVAANGRVLKSPLGTITVFQLVWATEATAALRLVVLLCRGVP